MLLCYLKVKNIVSMLMHGHCTEITWSECNDDTLMLTCFNPELQIRRGNRDNFGIIIHNYPYFSIKTYIETRH